MRILDRKLLRDLMRLRLSLIGIVAIMALGIACLVALGTVYVNLERSRDAYYTQSRMADFWIDLRRAPRTVLDDLAEVPGVWLAQGRIVSDTTVTIEGVPEAITARVVSLPAGRDTIINDVVLVSGRLVEEGERAEVLLNAAFARARKLGVGDTIDVLLNERRQTLTVVGTAMSSEFTYLVPPGTIAPEPEMYGVLYISEALAEDVLGHAGSINQVVGLLAPGVRDRPTGPLRRLELMLEPYGVFAVTPRRDQMSHWILTSELQELRTSTIVLPAVFLTAAALVLNALIGRLVQQQRTTIGALKAMGYTSRELFVHFTKFGLLLGLGGAVVGVGAGHGLAILMAGVYRQFFEFPSLEAAFEPRMAIIGAAVSLVFALLGVLRSAAGVMRLNAAEAMRPAPPERGGRSGLERWPALWRRLDFRWRTVLRAVGRHPARTFSGVFAAAFGAALVFLSLSLFDAAKSMIEFQFRLVLTSDVDVALREARSDAALLEVRRIEGVRHAEGVFNLACTLEHGHRSRRMAVTGLMEGASLTAPRDADGNAVPVPAAGLMLTRTLADVLGVELGDELILTPIRGDRRAREAPVAAIVESFLGMSAYAEIGYLSRLVGEPIAVTDLQLLLERGPGVENAVIAELRDRPAVATVGSTRLRRENIEKMLLEQMTTSLGVLIAFSGVLFLGSTLSSARMSLADRQREVATLRVLGYTSREVGGIFLRESLLVHTAGALVGLPLGYVLLAVMLRQYETEVFRIPLVVSPAGWIAPVVLGVVFTLVAHGFVQRTITRMNWLDIVNIKE